eukprot:TRINITY_DN19111_c0_g1_i1.p1 TRINITY_DN19111_c0_g1~~TRINITY_DN19111_c0_g1_i1.p1  ORF type:complete len:902 (+),score=268.44 TRINITY_DN19111_c0_g1_i1:109-2814(+)
MARPPKVGDFMNRCGKALQRVKRGEVRRADAMKEVAALGKAAMVEHAPQDFEAWQVCGTFTLHAALRLGAKSLLHWLTPRVVAIAPTLPDEEVVSLLWASWTLSVSHRAASSALGDRLYELAAARVLAYSEAAKCCAAVAETALARSHPLLLHAVFDVLVPPAGDAAAKRPAVAAAVPTKAPPSYKRPPPARKRQPAAVPLTHLQQAAQHVLKYYFPSRNAQEAVALYATRHRMALPAAAECMRGVTKRVNALFRECEARHAAGEGTARQGAYLLWLTAERSGTGVDLTGPCALAVRTLRALVAGGARGVGAARGSSIAAVVLKSWRILAPMRTNDEARAVAEALADFVCKAIPEAAPPPAAERDASAPVEEDGHLASIFSRIDAGRRPEHDTPPPPVVATPGAWEGARDALDEALVNDAATILTNVDAEWCPAAARRVAAAWVLPHMAGIGHRGELAVKCVEGLAYTAEACPEHVEPLRGLVAVLSTARLPAELAVRALRAAVHAGCVAPRFVDAMTKAVAAPPYPQHEAWVIRAAVGAYRALGRSEDLAALYNALAPIQTPPADPSVLAALLVACDATGAPVGRCGDAYAAASWRGLHGHEVAAAAAAAVRLRHTALPALEDELARRAVAFSDLVPYLTAAAKAGLRRGGVFRNAAARLGRDDALAVGDIPALVGVGTAWGLVDEVADALDAAVAAGRCRGGTEAACIEALLALARHHAESPCHVVIARLVEALIDAGEGGSRAALSARFAQLNALVALLAASGLRHDGVTQHTACVLLAAPAHTYALGDLERFAAAVAAAAEDNAEGGTPPRSSLEQLLLEGGVYHRLAHGWDDPPEAMWRSLLGTDSLFGRAVLGRVCEAAPPPDLPSSLPGTAPPDALEFLGGDDLILSAARSLAW